MSAVVTRTSSIPRIPRRPRVRSQAIVDAARADRLTAGWTTTPLPIDQIVRRNQRILVARSREQALNNDYAKKFLQMVRTNIVGHRGVQLQAQATVGTELDTEANLAIERAWREWGAPENCDVTGRKSWLETEKVALTTAARDGEWMIRIITGRDAGPWGFCLQGIDPQRCRPDLDERKLRNGRFIRHGIEFSRFGRPLAYHFQTVRAEDGDDAYTFGGRTYIRVPAAQIIHGFMSDFDEQKRGLPWMATALLRLHMLGGFEQASLVNARVGASKAGFFQWREGYGPAEDPVDEPEPLSMEVEPGTYNELPTGLEAVKHDPMYPTGEFSPFSKAMLRGAASGLGVSYVNLANDLEGVNFSSIRQGTLDEREYWKECQEWFIGSLHRRVFMEWLPRALLSGRIVGANGRPYPARRLDDFRHVEWQPRRWDWIDPNADVKAAVTAVDRLFMSPSQVIRDRGRDPDTVWREIKRDLDAMKAAGIPEHIIAAVISGKATGGSPKAPTANPPEEQADD